MYRFGIVYVEQPKQKDNIMSENIKRITKYYTGEYVAKVLWVSTRDKNGILKTVDGHEIYFDVSVCNCDFDTIKRGNYMEFEFNQNITNCLCAKNIRHDNVENILPELNVNVEPIETDSFAGNDLYFNNNGLFNSNFIKNLK